MNKIFSFAAIVTASLLGFTSCMDDYDTPNTDNYIVTAPAGTLGDVNVTISQIKSKFCAGRSSGSHGRNNYNYYTEVIGDSILTAVVAANDISGNLYQTLLLRNIESDGTDQSIILKVKNTCLYPYFAVGQRIKLNLKGLWVGVYSYTPQIGTPYKTSSGNLNLGPMEFNLCQTNIELVGKPDASVPECQPIDYTTAAGEAALDALKPNTNKADYSITSNIPTLATVKGKIKQVQGATASKPETGASTDNKGEKEPITEINGNYLKIFAPYQLHDDGYGVDRDIILDATSKSVTLRTSTKNDISYRYIPKDSRSYTGILQYDSYDKVWQIQLRSLDDISPVLPTNKEYEAQLSQQ